MPRKKLPADPPRSHRHIAPTPVRLSHFYHSVLDYFSDTLEMSTSDVIRMAIDGLLRSQPPEVIAGHRRYAEAHYLADLQDDAVARSNLVFALNDVQRAPSKEMRVDASEMRLGSEGARFDGFEVFGGDFVSHNLGDRIDSAEALGDDE